MRGRQDNHGGETAPKQIPSFLKPDYTLSEGPLIPQQEVVVVPPGDGDAHWYSAEVEVQLTVEVQIYPQDNLVTTISFLTAILHRLQESLGHSDAQNNNAAKSDVGVPPRALCPFPGLRLPVYPSHRCSYQYITVPQPVSAHLQNPTAENRENMGPGSWHRSCQSPDSPDSARSPSLGGAFRGCRFSTSSSCSTLPAGSMQ